MATPTPVSDADLEFTLLKRFVAGDRAALGQLAAIHERAMLGLARGLLGGDASAACDAVQATWVRVIRFAKGFKGQSSVKTWMYRILVNECRDLRRRSMRFALGEMEAQGDEQGFAAPEDHDHALHAALARLTEDRAA